MLCMAVARKWQDVYSNAVDPGWAPTKMGGRGAPDDLQKGHEIQVWLAGSNDVQMQELFLSWCKVITGVSFPG